MLGLSPLGTFHTAVSLIAVGAGFFAVGRDRAILPQKPVGKIYVIATVVTCLTGFGIFHHGTFGPAHQLGVITLVVLGVAAVAGRTAWFGRASRYVETLSYSLTLFFHMIPAFTETATRLPVGSPLVSGPEAPALQAAIGGAFLIFLVGAAYQVRRLRASSRAVT